MVDLFFVSLGQNNNNHLKELRNMAIISNGINVSSIIFYVFSSETKRERKQTFIWFEHHLQQCLGDVLILQTATIFEF